MPDLGAHQACADRIVQLVAALEEYGQHKRHCAASAYKHPPDRRWPCTCGLTSFIDGTREVQRG